jgi:proton-dependent oligopeptide transporter, POT family
MTTNTISQAGRMQTHGIPNDMLPNINSFTVIVFLPLTTQLLYPFLRRYRIEFPPLARISLGFFLESLGMAWAAVVQYWIYHSGPCSIRAPAQNLSMEPCPTVLLQIPIYFLEGIGEIFASPAGWEYAFMIAPKSMKSVLQAIFAMTAAGGSVFGLALSPTYKDPNLLSMYAGLAGVMFVTALLVIILFVFSRKTIK